MNLLRRNEDGSFSLQRFNAHPIPTYAILSHTWGKDEEEVSQQDVVIGTGTEKVGYQKLLFCASQAKEHHLEYFWIDTCCIDRSNHVELQRAINSMFKYYQNSSRCYALLSDVTIYAQNGQHKHLEWHSAFYQSRWFRRGWTLQELLAPKTVEFYSRDHIRLGSKHTLNTHIISITGIPNEALLGTKPLSHFAVATRLAWADDRHTKEDEDIAYCLLGVFGVFLPLIYGEGRESALRRLRKEVTESDRGLPHDAGFPPPPFHPSAGVANATGILVHGGPVAQVASHDPSSILLDQLDERATYTVSSTSPMPTQTQINTVGNIANTEKRPSHNTLSWNNTVVPRNSALTVNPGCPLTFIQCLQFVLQQCTEDNKRVRNSSSCDDSDLLFRMESSGRHSRWIKLDERSTPIDSLYLWYCGHDDSERTALATQMLHACTRGKKFLTLYFGFHVWRRCCPHTRHFFFEIMLWILIAQIYDNEEIVKSDNPPQARNERSGIKFSQPVRQKKLEERYGSSVQQHLKGFYEIVGEPNETDQGADARLQMLTEGVRDMSNYISSRPVILILTDLQELEGDDLRTLKSMTDLILSSQGTSGAASMRCFITSTYTDCIREVFSKVPAITDDDL